MNGGSTITELVTLSVRQYGISKIVREILSEQVDMPPIDAANHVLTCPSCQISMRGAVINKWNERAAHAR